MTFAHHLLAEFEQVAHQDRRKREDAKNGLEVKAKRFEENGSGGKSAEGKGGKGEKTSNPPCKFFLSDGGCKKGKSCGWPHVTDEKRRCWICGSVAHLAPACDRPREASKENGEKYGKGAEGKGSQKMVQRQEKKEEGPAKGEEPPQSEAQAEEPSSTSVEMKGLLEEATKMLKGLAKQSNEKEQKGREDRLAAMQDQLDELRKVKVLKISKMGKEDTVYGLLDSGATHPMRAARPGEDLSACESVRVTLADGHQVDMVMTPKGIMVVENGDVEPIVPMSMVAGELGYVITWKKGSMQVEHPRKGALKVIMRNGCPQIPKKKALQLIQELEGGKKMKKIQEEEKTAEEKWLRQLVKAHRVKGASSTPSAETGGQPSRGFVFTAGLQQKKEEEDEETRFRGSPLCRRIRRILPDQSFQGSGWRHEPSGRDRCQEGTRRKAWKIS